MRDTMIRKKMSELESSLVSWAERHDLLGPGETLVLSVSIVKEVFRSEQSELLGLKPSEFFDEAGRRLESLGAPKGIPTRAYCVSKNSNPQNGCPWTMREFIAAYGDEKVMCRKLKNCGRITAMYMMRAMIEVGLIKE